MSTRLMSLKESLAPFFGEPEKVPGFMNANYPKRDYTVAPNDSANPESIDGTMMGDMLQSKNYSQKEAGMADNDVHNEMVDFVVRTALKHKELDRPSTVGQLEEINKNFDNVVDTALNQKLDPKYTTAMNLHFINGLPAGLNRLDIWELLNTATTGRSNHGSKTFFDYICASLYAHTISFGAELYLASVAGGPNTRPFNRNDIFNTTHTSNILLNGTQRLSDLIQRIHGTCNVASPSTSRVSNGLCFATYFDNNSNSSAMAIISETLYRLANDGKIVMPMNGVRHVKDTIEEEYKKAIYGLYIDILNQLGTTNMPSLYAFFRNLVPNINAPNIRNIINVFQTQVLNNASLRQRFSQNLKDVSKDVFKTYYNKLGGKSAYTNLTSNDVTREFCRKVLKNWVNLDKDAQKFYMDNIEVYRKRNINAQYLMDESGWSDNLLSDPQQLAGIDCDSNNVQDLRVNLMKEQRGSQMTRFASTLPLLSKKLYGKVWYTDANGRKQSLQNSDWTATILRDIYVAVYLDQQAGASVTLNIGRTSITVPTSYQQVLRVSNNMWSWNHVLFIKASIMPKKSPPKSQPLQMLDNETGQIWHSDGTSLYKIVNGKKVVYDTNNYTDCVKNLGLNENGINGPVCDNLAKCIIAEPNNLADCLRNLASYDMFQVAEKELREMDPYVAKKLMAIFHILPEEKNVVHNGNIIKVLKPMTFKNWEQNVLNNTSVNPKGWTTEFRKILSSNSQLLQYVRGLISFVSTNYPILNEDKKLQGKNIIDNDEREDEQVKLLKEYGVELYQYPRKGTVEEVEFNTALVYQDVSAFKPLPLLATPYMNALFGGGMMNNNGIINSMGGGSMIGGKYDNDDDLGSTLIRYYKDLENTGIKFEKGTLEIIKNYANQLRIMQNKLHDMNEILAGLRKAVERAKCYNSNWTNNIEGRTLDLDEITENKDNADLIKVLGSGINEYEICLDTTYNKLNEGVSKYVGYVDQLIKNVSVGKRQQ